MPDSSIPARSASAPAAVAFVALVAVAVALVALPAPAVAATTPSLAVTYFQNNSGDANYEPLGHGLAEMLITDLSQVEGVRIVERGRLNDILEELSLQASSFVDKSTAVKVGKGVGAAFVLTGSFATVAPDMRIDARIIDVSTSEVVRASSVTGRSDEFFLLEKELATTILEGLAVQISARESAKMGRVQTESFDAFVEFSRGVEAMDRGALAEARTALAAALEKDDRFALAGDQMDRLRKRLEEMGEKAQQASSAAAQTMLIRLNEIIDDGGPWDELSSELMQFSSRAPLPKGAADIYAVCGRIIDAKLPETLKLGGPGGTMAINEWAFGMWVLSMQTLGLEADYLTYGEAFLVAYPSSAWGMSIRTSMSRLLDLMEARQEGRAQVPKVLAEARAQVLDMRCNQERRPQTRVESCREWYATLEQAGLPIEDEVFYEWSEAARSGGDLEELGRVLELSRKGRDKYDSVPTRIESSIESLEKKLERAEKSKAKLAEADDDGDYTRASRDVADVGDYEGAWKILGDALKRWPAEDDVHAARLRLAAKFGDLPRAEKALADWEAAEAQGAKVNASDARSVASLRDWQDRLASFDSMELMKRASGLREAGQLVESAEAWIELADRYPDTAMGSVNALQAAAGAFCEAWEQERCRATYEKILTDYPDEDASQTARTMLELMP